MSISTSKRVWDKSARGGSALLLLIAMADWSDDWGYCYPTLDRMADKCRQTERNILNLIGGLEQAGELRRVARGKGGRGKLNGSVYQVTTGMTAVEIRASEQLSPLARSTLARLENGEMHRPQVKTDEKRSGEKFSGEKQSPDISPVSPLPLNELINTSDKKTPAPLREAAESGSWMQAEALYRLVRPTHFAIPNSDQRQISLKVLGIYLNKFGSAQAAAEALKPFAQEADARGISPTNLCWLSEWAAVGQIPRQRGRRSGKERPARSAQEQVNYDDIRERMKAELAPIMADAEDTRSRS